MLSRRNKKKGNRIGTLKKGLLIKYGYHNVADLSLQKRHSALTKAMKAYGTLSVYRKLNAVYVYNRKTNPFVARIFKADRDWVLKMLH
jgi:hypothetical protein